MLIQVPTMTVGYTKTNFFFFPTVGTDINYHMYILYLIYTNNKKQKQQQQQQQKNIYKRKNNNSEIPKFENILCEHLYTVNMARIQNFKRW